MAKCQYPACAHTAAASGRFCSNHQKTANLTLPTTPMAVQVMEQLEWDRLQATMVTRDRRGAGAESGRRAQAGARRAASRPTIPCGSRWRG